MQLLEVSCVVRRIYTSLGAKGLNMCKAILPQLLQDITVIKQHTIVKLSNIKIREQDQIDARNCTTFQDPAVDMCLLHVISAAWTGHTRNVSVSHSKAASASYSHQHCLLTRTWYKDDFMAVSRKFGIIGTVNDAFQWTQMLKIVSIYTHSTNL